MFDLQSPMSRVEFGKIRVGAAVAKRWRICPFHVERTPSMLVDLEKGKYKCFGCGREGEAKDLPQEVNKQGGN